MIIKNALVYTPAHTFAPGDLAVRDGRIDPDTAPLVRDAGATVLVAGSAVYGKADRAAAIAAIRGE